MVAGKTADQICRMDARGCFVEVRSSMFEPKKEGKLGKVMFNFVEYDQSTNKAVKSIPIYVDIPKLLVLTDDIRLGYFKREMQAEIKRCQQAGDRYCRAVWEDLGGTSATALNLSGRPRKDGKSESRIFEICPAAKEGYVLLKAKRGPGNEQNKGIIAPDYKAGSFEQVCVLVSFDELRAMAKLIDINVTAYESRKWMNGGHDYAYETNQSANPYAGNHDYYAPAVHQPSQRNPKPAAQTAYRKPPANKESNKVTPFAAPSDQELSDTGFNPFAAQAR